MKTSNAIRTLFAGVVLYSSYCSAQLTPNQQQEFRQNIPYYINDSKRLQPQEIAMLSNKPILTPIEIACLSYFKSDQALEVCYKQIQIQTNDYWTEKLFDTFNQLTGDSIPYTTNAVLMRKAVVEAYKKCSHRLPYLQAKLKGCNNAQAREFIVTYCCDLDPTLCIIYDEEIKNSQDSPLQELCKELLLRNGGFQPNAVINTNNLNPDQILTRYKAYLSSKYQLQRLTPQLASYLLLLPNDDKTGTLAGGLPFSKKPDIDRFLLFRIVSY